MATPNPPSSSSSAAGRSAAPSPLPRATVTAAAAAAAAAAQQGSSSVRFDSEMLKKSMRSILQARLGGQSWPKGDKEAQRRTTRELAEEIKGRMLEMEPRGFKYVVQVQLVENLGQGGRADLACHWEDADTVSQEMFANDSLICTVSAFAIRSF